jgi:Family of unknown function (DUF6364)
MKSRVTITLNSDLLRQAKIMARDREISLSALIEDLLKKTTDQGTNKRVSFSDKWAGKFKLRKTQNDPLLEAINAHYKLES